MVSTVVVLVYWLTALPKLTIHMHVLSSQIIPVCLLYDLQLITKIMIYPVDIVMSWYYFAPFLKKTYSFKSILLNELVDLWIPLARKSKDIVMHRKCCNLGNPNPSGNRLTSPTSELTVRFFHSEEIGCCPAYGKMLKPLKDLWLSIVFLWYCTWQESIEIRRH